MENQPQATQPERQSETTDDYRALVKKIADKVWELWKKDLRYGRDRQGTANRKT